jgi:hypothetical protein
LRGRGDRCLSDLLELAETGVINHRMQVPFTSIDEAVTLAKRYATEICIVDEDGVWHREWGELTGGVT